MDVDMEECNISSIEEMKHDALIQRQIESGQFQTINPETDNNNADVLTFNINSDQYYIELDKTELDIKFKVQKHDDADNLVNLTADDNVGIINYPGACLFKDIEVVLQGEKISVYAGNYAHRAMMETLLSFSDAAQNTWMQSALFYKDTAEQMDITDAKDGANDGLKKRAAFIAGSKIVEIRSKLHLDLFQQPKPLVNNMRMTLKFEKNNHKFLFMSNVDKAHYEAVIQSMSLRIRKVKMSDSVMKENANASIPYPLHRVCMQEFTIGKDLQKKSQTLHNGRLPKKIVLGLINNSAGVGSYKYNPFNFQHFNVSDIDLRKNGNTVNGYPLKFNFKVDHYNDGYWSLCRAMDKRFRDEGFLISRKDYKGGYALYAFDISPSQCGDDFVDPTQTGHIDINITFSEKTKESLTLCVYMQFDNDKIVIDKFGHVTTYYSYSSQ